MSRQQKQESRFEAVYYPDGMCNIYPCDKPGVVLAYDDFSPEVGLWFCEEDWDDLGIVTPMFTIVEDKRQPKGEQV